MVVDDHAAPSSSQDSTSARSSGVVTFSSRGSPATTVHAAAARLDERRAVRRRRRVARDRRAQHVGDERLRRLHGRRARPAGASRRPPRPRDALDRVDDREARDRAVPALVERRRAGARPPRRRRAAARRRARATTAASSADLADADAARTRPASRRPRPTPTTFPQPSSSASRITGSSQPGGATTTIESIQSEASSRSRLSARSGRPPSGANAFGRSRWPAAEPLAATGGGEDGPDGHGRRRER